MRPSAILLFASAVAALPQAKGTGGAGTGAVNPLKGGNGANKPGTGDQVANELTEGACKDIIFIMARASTEPGNMGGSMGPQICKGLKTAYPDRVACQGVGGPYSAGIMDNVQPKGTTAAAIGEGTKMFKMADSKCPSSKIVFGGYSQGTAVMHNVVGALPAAIKQKIPAGVLFGDTRNKQDHGQVPNYPKDQVMIFCDAEDGVCGGALKVTNAHMVYVRNGDGPKAIAFLKGKLDPVLKAPAAAAASRA
ncbi:hypothetical protein E2P81_ATG05214 [Venturia nashicola]|uniref:Cutinase n=1 Tax=Venturia nashicola TaxID=86259 RepID=A0A4Z1P2P2_9PEZI|nr:hypothetical protein E6O75_ATG05343 [Venturia nashicola]TLD32238.1 hypothetical protein E2P81_ATG05214 [Venturia nashicola]